MIGSVPPVPTPVGLSPEARVGCGALIAALTALVWALTRYLWVKTPTDSK
jgi:hypothetical protein